MSPSYISVGLLSSYLQTPAPYHPFLVPACTFLPTGKETAVLRFVLSQSFLARSASAMRMPVVTTDFLVEALQQQQHS